MTRLICNVCFNRTLSIPCPWCATGKNKTTEPTPLEEMILASPPKDDWNPKSQPQPEANDMSSEPTADQIDVAELDNMIQQYQRGLDKSKPELGDAFPVYKRDILLLAKAVRTLLPSNDATPSPNREHSQAEQDEVDQSESALWKEHDQRKSSSSQQPTPPLQSEQPRCKAVTQSKEWVSGQEWAMLQRIRKLKQREDTLGTLIGRGCPTQRRIELALRHQEGWITQLEGSE